MLKDKKAVEIKASKFFKRRGLILISCAARTSFAQISNCSYPAQTVTAYANFNATITSPNYPVDYYDNLECAWLITVNNSLSFRGYIVKVTFNDFRLEQSSPCNDVLKFYDGMSAGSTLLGSYCGTTHSEVIYSTGENLYVKFHADFLYSYKGSGFSFRFSAVRQEEASGICRPWYGGNTVQTLSGPSGTFFSPGYPVPFPENGRCIWTITVPSGKRVKLKFEDLDLVTSYTSCNQQNVIEMGFVQIRDGQDQESRELAFHCGYQSSFSGIPEVYSTGRYMRVDFFSNSPKGWDGRKGFKARYEAVDFGPSSRELCFNENVYKNDLQLNGSSGTLQSPQEPGYYPPGSSCDWLITVPDGNIIKLSFDRFYLEPTFGSTCTADYVEVFDGRNSNSKSKGRFCGDIIPGDIHSSNRYMWVRFRSDTKFDFNGFKATYTAEAQDKLSSTSSSALIVGIVVGVIVFIAIICSIVCFIKHKKKPSGPAVPTIPMSTTTAAESHTTQPEVNPYPSPPVG
ncbi:hypothetical protein ACROYT_G020078 [Oculina patagonica]